MSKPSQWPLTFDAIRSILPRFIVQELIENPLSNDCHPIAMGYYPRASGHNMVRDQHDDNLLIYCTAGTGHVTTDNFTGSVNKGDLLLLPANTLHRYHADKRTPWSIYWLHFSGANCALLIDNLGYEPTQPVMPLGIQPQLIADFKQLVSARHTGYSSTTYLHAAALVRQILCALPLITTAVQKTRNDSFDIEAIQQFMLQHLHEDLDLETLSSAFHLSKYHFSNRYKKLTDQSPIKHFIHMKMEQACYLLDSTVLPVSSIALQLGYDDPLYFSRLFRKTIGLSPSKYRQELRG